MADPNKVGRKDPTSPINKIRLTNQPSLQHHKNKNPYINHPHPAENIEFTATALKTILQAFGRTLDLKVLPQEIQAFEGSQKVFSVSHEKASKIIEEIHLILSPYLDRMA